MLAYFLQSWLIMLLFFVIGAAVAAIVAGSIYRPIDEVRAELDAEFGPADALTGGDRR